LGDNEIHLNIIDGAKRGVWIIPKSDITKNDIFYALKANENQSAEMRLLFCEYIDNADHEFFDSGLRKNLLYKTVLSLGKSITETVEIKNRTTKDLGDNNTGKKLLSYTEKIRKMLDSVLNKMREKLKVELKRFAFLEKKDLKEKIPVPNLPPLPKTGTLYSVNNKPYLAIKDWDEFDLGQKEAKKLKAILCAERSGNGCAENIFYY
jgi:hypothetical protein